MATITPPSGPRFTVLGIVQNVCAALGQPVPGALKGGSSTALQWQQLLQEVGEFAQEYTDWEFCRRTAEWTVVSASMDQGLIRTRAPDSGGSLRILPGSFWSLTQRLRVQGPVSEAQWASFMAEFASPWKHCRLAEGRIWIFPAPSLDEVYRFQYLSNHWVVTSDGVTKDWIDADTDVPLFTPSLMRKGLAFYWKRAKELPYLAEEARFMDALADYASANVLRQTVYMDNDAKPANPGIVVPITGWGQP